MKIIEFFGISGSGKPQLKIALLKRLKINQKVVMIIEKY